MKVIHFFIFILVTSCSTLNVLVMSGQLKVGYRTTAAAAKLFRSLWCNFIYGNFTFISASLPTLSLQEQITFLQI